jgi:hypothetical protein
LDEKWPHALPASRGLPPRGRFFILGQSGDEKTGATVPSGSRFRDGSQCVPRDKFHAWRKAFSGHWTVARIPCAGDWHAMIII